MLKTETVRANYTSLLDTQFNELTDFVLSDVDNGESSGGCNMCRKKMVHRRLPFLSWIPKYSTSDAICDLKGGLVVGMTVVPQGLAFACIVGLPAEYGLYGTFMTSFVYAFLGSYKDSAAGPNPVAALLVGQIAGGVWQRAILLTFLTGLIEVALGIFRLGFIVDFVSGPVNAGFNSAVALLIVTSQMKRNMLDLQTPGRSFVELWSSIVKDINKIHVADTTLGMGCIICLVVMRWLGDVRIGPKEEYLQSSSQKCINKCLWFMGISRNAFVVLVTALIGWHLERTGNQHFSLVGYMPPGVPTLALPAFSIPEIRGNGTNGEEVIIQKGETFMEMVSYLGSGLIVVPLIALLDNISVCKAIAKGKAIDTTQELLVSGIANVGNSLVQGYRSNGALPRSALLSASGGRTQMTNFVIGAIVVLSLIYLMPCLAFVPKATLASLIIGFIIFTVQYNVIVPMWKSKKIDLIPGFATFIATLLLPIQIGLLVGIAINMVFIVYHSARPKVTVNVLKTSSGQLFVRLTPDRSLMFPSVEFVRNIINKSGIMTTLPVVVDCSYIYGADFTAANAVTTMVKDFDSRNQKIVFYNLKPSVAQVLEGVTTNLIVCYDKSQLELELTKVKNGSL